ncbi:erythromycin esterase-domain-containing protein [Tirmania nivea]|nr:erythromycin esterase-domain-containing protein [Tirmania nivea]
MLTQTIRRVYDGVMAHASITRTCHFRHRATRVSHTMAQSKHQPPSFTCASYPLATPTSIGPVTSFVKDASIVLLGEATHGTHEFYAARAAITKDLIANHGFEVVAMEADWPDSYRANRYAIGCTEDKNAKEALSGFRRFPSWMWANDVVAEFIDWLREHNKGKMKVGFYGLDLYSLNASQSAVIEYLQKVDPKAAVRAKRRYECFDHAGGDPKRYGLEVAFGARERGKAGVVLQLVEMLRNTQKQLERYLSGADGQDSAAAFYAEQNARVVKNAEEYYTSMFDASRESWNVRDGHMMETLERLVQWIRVRDGGQGKVVVWAHNSHLGDCRATQMGKQGQLNLGQLVREKWGENCKNIGFTTYTGTVMAADEWDTPGKVKNVIPAREDSFEWSLNQGGESFFLPLTGEEVKQDLGGEKLERAIGVIYLPQTERLSHYFYADLRKQFNGVVHFRKTTALKPLIKKEEKALEEESLEEELIG